MSEETAAIELTNAPAIEIRDASGRLAVSVSQSGKVTLTEGVSVDAAALSFWDAIEGYAQRMGLPTLPCRLADAEQKTAQAEARAIEAETRLANLQALVTEFAERIKGYTDAIPELRRELVGMTCEDGTEI